jgi:hypothetical protein
MSGDSDSDDDKPINQLQSSSYGDVELQVLAEQMVVRFHVVFGYLHKVLFNNLDTVD